MAIELTVMIARSCHIYPTINQPVTPPKWNTKFSGLTSTAVSTIPMMMMTEAVHFIYQDLPYPGVILFIVFILSPSVMLV